MIIYKITNRINDKIYIGQDSKNNPNYFGSGLLIKKAIKKYGKEYFKKEILEICNNLDELNEREFYWIEKLNSMDHNIGYNIDCGGNHQKRSKETLDKISKANTGKKRTIEEKEDLSKKAKKRWSDIDERKKQSDRANKRWSDDNEIEMARKRTIEYFENPENREHNSLKQMEVWSKWSEEEKQIICDKKSKTMIDICKDPEYKEWHSNILKDYYKKNPDKLLKAQQIAWKNKEKIYKILTPDGEIVEIKTRKSVLEYIKCSGAFFAKKEYRGYKLIEVIKPNK